MIRLSFIGGKWKGLEIQSVDEDLDNIQFLAEEGVVIIASEVDDLYDYLNIDEDDIEIIE